MTIRAGSRIDATDFDLPDVVTAFGNGTNSITATAFTVLPTNTCTAAITNPHPTANLMLLVAYGAWMNSTTSSDVRMALDISGATTIAAGIGGGGAIGWGEIPLVSAGQVSIQVQSTITVSCAPGTTTFKTFAMRAAASGTHSVNYPTIRLVPLYFLF
jgi:hypothetical protein